jgi:hypothetical protein
VADAERLCACLGLCERGLCPVGNAPQRPAEPRTAPPTGERVPEAATEALRAASRVDSGCVNDTDGDGDCAACARNPKAACRQTLMTPAERHEIDPTHEWYPGDGCPVCAREAVERRYGHLTEDERRYFALAARSHADVQTRTAELWRNNAKNDTLAAAHVERAARWREIADGFHTDPWGNGS